MVSLTFSVPKSRAVLQRFRVTKATQKFLCLFSKDKGNKVTNSVKWSSKLLRRSFVSGIISGVLVVIAESPSTAVVTEETFLKLDKLVEDATAAWDRGLDPTNLERFKDLYQACDIFDQIIVLDPDTVEWYEARGQVRIDAKKFNEALEDFNEALRRNPNNYKIYSSRALAYEGLADWENAIANYNLALNLGKESKGYYKDPYVLNSRGNAYLSLGLYREALDDYQESATVFQKSRELDGFIYSSSNAALVRIQLGEEKEGIRELAAVARRAPASIDMRAALAAIYWSQGEERKAEEEWEFACENINAGQVYDGCAKYKDSDWLRRIRRWPPVMVQRMDNFFKLK